MQNETSTNKEHLSPRRIQLGFSFVGTHRENINLINRTIQGFGLVGEHTILPDGTYRTDGNISTNLFTDVSLYGKEENDLLTIWNVDSTIAREGFFAAERKIKPIHRLTFEQAREIQDVINVQKEIDGSDQLTRLEQLIQPILENSENSQLPDQEVKTHTVLPPERLVATCEIREEGKKALASFEEIWVPRLMRDFNEVQANASQILRDIIDQYFSFKFSTVSSTELADDILETTYFSVLKQRARQAWDGGWDKKDPQFMNAFLEIKAKDRVSERYIREIMSVLHKKAERKNKKSE